MTPFPNLNLDSMSVVANAARLAATGQIASIDKLLTGNAVWDLQGYGMKVLLKGGQNAPPSSVEDLASLAECLQGHCTRCGAGADPEHEQKSLPWASILKMLLTLLPIILPILPLEPAGPIHAP